MGNPENREMASDMELASLLIKHIESPCEDLDGNNVRSVYIREAKIALGKMSDLAAKKLLEDVVKKYSEDVPKSRTKLEMLEATPNGLDLDAKNLFGGAHRFLQNTFTFGSFERIVPLQTYEAYLRGHLSSEMAEEVIRKSNPANIQRVNELVEEYNSAIPKIKEESNAQLGLDILKKMNQVFVGRE